MNNLFLFLFFFTFSTLQALSIDKESSNIQLLSSSEIVIEDIQTSNDIAKEFKPYKPYLKDILTLGFAPQKVVWIRFTLTNTSDTKLVKIIEYANAETEEIHFYDGNKTVIDGMWHISKNRETLHPIFTITLNPYETRTYYMSAHSSITTLVVSLGLWNELDFFKEDFQQKTYIFVFFAAIMILLLYNGMLFLFTRDKAYLYYVLYLFAVICFESIYLGVAQLYLFSNTVSVVVTKATTAYISLLVLPIILFTREFLNTQRFEKLDMILKIYMYALPLISLLSYNNMVFDQNIMAVFIPLGITIIYIAFYAFTHGVAQAKYYLIGWSFLLLSLITSVLESFGVIFINAAYMNELAFTFEALFFSIALAHRINIINQEKAQIQSQLIQWQKEEQTRLENIIHKKTKELTHLLEKKEILYKELNHRVKNNLAMVLSLIKLQIATTPLQQTKESLTVTQNRIASIATLYEILNTNGVENSIDTKEYIQKIVTVIAKNFDKADVSITYNITYNIDIESLIYCGLVVNELVTNSYKYAFDEKGLIVISLHHKNGCYILSIKDNGKGFSTTSSKHLGLNIVKNIARKQLPHGTFYLKANKGTKVTVTWRKDAK